MFFPYLKNLFINKRKYLIYMKNVYVAIIGEDDDAQEVLFKGFKKFPANEIVLLTKKKTQTRK